MSAAYLILEISNGDHPSKVLRLDIQDAPGKRLKTDLLTGNGAGREYLANLIYDYHHDRFTQIFHEIERMRCKIGISVHIDLDNGISRSEHAEDLMIERNHDTEKIRALIKTKMQKIINKAALDSALASQNNNFNSRDNYSDNNVGPGKFQNGIDIQLLDKISISEQAVDSEITIIEFTQNNGNNDMETRVDEPEINSNINNSDAHLSGKPVPSENGTSLSSQAENTVIGVEKMEYDPQPSHQVSEKLVIVVRREALERAREHAVSQQDAETGGVLLGQFIPNRGKTTTVLVTGIIRGLHTIRRTASLTFTPETWAQVLYWMDNDPVYSDDTAWSIVGWYHTHPSFGIFLSSYDLSIHGNHFRRREHIALVIDPKSKNDPEGFFSWDKTITKISRQRDYQVKTDDEIRKYLGLKELPAAEVMEPRGKESKE